MSEAKPAIPPETVKAAVVAYLNSFLPEKFHPLPGEDHSHGFLAYGEAMVSVALEAAGVGEMLARIAELESELVRLLDVVDSEDAAIIEGMLKTLRAREARANEQTVQDRN